MADGDVTFDDNEMLRILNGAPLQAEVRRVCQAIMLRARTISPVGETSEYVNSFRIELVRFRKRRVVGFVINDSEHAALVEARYGVLTKARRAR